MPDLIEISRRAGSNRRRSRTSPVCETLEARSLLTVTASFAVTQDWGSGFQGAIVLTNQGSANVNNWVLEFDYGAKISSIWDASIVSKTGNHYVIRNAGWNRTIPAGGTVSFGFVGSPGGTQPSPTNYKVNGVPPGNPLPSITVNDAAGTEPTAGSVPLTFSVKLSSAATTPITVRYATSDGTARAGGDYTAAGGTLTFAPGETSKDVAVAVLADLAAEGDETFRLDLSDPNGATLARSAGVGTIREAKPPETGDVTFEATSDWGTGFNGRITVKNSGATAWKSWTLEFDFAGRINSIWDATIVSHVGNRYVITNAFYNGEVAPGATVSFGFTGARASAAIVPTGYVVRGGGPVAQPPTAANDTGWTSPGKSVTVPVLANDSDPNGGALTVLSAAQGQHGTVAVENGQAIRFTPAAGFTGTDTFTYIVGNGTGLTASATVTVTVSALVWPERVYTPYVDMTLYPTYNLVDAARNQGLKYFNLAFIVADPNKKPAWGGYAEYAVNGGAFDQAMRSQITTLRGLGGDVAVSFGGASNLELAQAIADVPTLQSAYQSVIDAYALTRVDFDIEGAAAAEHASIDRRSQAIAGLQRDAAAAGRTLQVWYTLPVLPDGLTHDGVYVLQSALNHGVNIGGVNVMAMDYGDSAAPNPQGRMGDYAIQAATSTFGQVRNLYGTNRTESQIWAMIGVTPMIGLNDVTTEVFTQADARKLLTFAQQKGLGEIGIWSLNRDRQNPNGAINYVETTSSSILQTPYEFSLIFKEFTS